MKTEVPSGRMKKGSELANSYLSLYVHIVFSTKGREALVTP